MKKKNGSTVDKNWSLSEKKLNQPRQKFQKLGYVQENITNTSKIVDEKKTSKTDSKQLSKKKKVIKTVDWKREKQLEFTESMANKQKKTEN